MDLTGELKYLCCIKIRNISLLLEHLEQLQMLSDKGKKKKIKIKKQADTPGEGNLNKSKDK